MAKIFTNDPAVRKFAKRHGDFVVLPDDHWYLFETGAKLEATTCGIAVMEPPPSDPWERAKLFEEYCKIKAQAAVAEFDQFWNYCHVGEGVCPADVCDEEEQLEHLKKLRTNSRKLLAKLREARRERKALTPAWLVAKRREDARQRRERENFKAKIKAIDL